MGTSLAPYVNTFMVWFEDKYVYTYDVQRPLWAKCIDCMSVLCIIDMGSLIAIFVTFMNS